jgi:predicted metal-dependent peptidase
MTVDTPTPSAPSLRRMTDDEAARLAPSAVILLESAPYLATIWFELDTFVAPGLNTFAVDDKWRLYIDPAAMDRWGVEGTAAVLQHEIHHVLRDHAGRCRAHGVPKTKPGHEAWNIAGDAEINDDLRQIGVTLPEGCVYPDMLGLDEGKSAEFYYDNLPRNPNGDQGSDDSGDGQGQSDGAGDPSDGQSNGDGVGNGSGPEGDQSGNGNGGQGDESSWPNFDGCGSGSGGQEAPCESAAPEDSGRDEASRDLARRATAQAIRDAAAKGRGTIPGALEEWANQVLAPPTVPWRKVLQSSVRRAMSHQRGMLDYTWRRPSRRDTGNVLRPSMFAPKPRVAVVIDTSGSMSKKDLSAALAEVEGVIRQAGVRGDDLRVLDVDAQVHGSQRVRSAQQVRLRGRGGTDMRVGIEAAAADKRHDPHIIVVLTDGMTPWPDKEIPGVSVIAAIIGDYGATGIYECPPWIKKVLVGQDVEVSAA